MELAGFDRLKAQITAATAGQLLELENLIHHVVSEQTVEMALARRTKQTTQNRCCPHCGSDNVVLHGKDENLRQRFRCRGCRRTYNIMTGTPMARARKPEKWFEYLGYMTEHMSVRKIVKAGIGVHKVTVWRWRHRFLKAAANDNALVLSGVIEADKTFFPRSFKGSRGWKRGTPPENRAARPRASGATKRRLSYEQVPVLTAIHNSGAIFEQILPSLSDIEAALHGRITAGSVLCSDGSAAYVNAAAKADAEHFIVTIPTTTPYALKINPVRKPVRTPGKLGLGPHSSPHFKRPRKGHRMTGTAIRFRRSGPSVELV